MIKFEQFAIDADDNQYIAGEIKLRTVKKDGQEVREEYIARPTYHTTLSHAVQSLLNLKQRRLVSSNDIELKTALIEFDKLQQRFENLLDTSEEIK